MKKISLIIYLFLAAFLISSNFIVSYSSIVLGETVNEKISVGKSKSQNLNNFNAFQKQALTIKMETVIESYYVDNELAQTSAVKYLKDFSNNDFILFEYNPVGYLIYNVANGDVIEAAPYSSSPFKGYKTNLYYVPMSGYFVQISPYKYYNIINQTSFSEIKDIERLTSISKEIHEKSLLEPNIEFLDYLSKVDRNKVDKVMNEREILRLKTRSDIEKYPSEDGIIFAEHEVPYSWFFKNSKTDFGYTYVEGTKGQCGYIALAMLLAYHDIFISSGYFSSLEKSYITPIFGIPNNPVNEPQKVPSISSDLTLQLYNYYKKSGTFSTDLKKAMNKFMSGKNISYDHYDRYIFFGDICMQIKNGYPVIAFGSYPDANNPSDNINHAVVVYGYDIVYNTPMAQSYKYYVHYGWNYASQVILSSYVIGSMYAVHNKQEHEHSWYYQYGSFVYCPCGASAMYVR